jgi:hypothetical protein
MSETAAIARAAERILRRQMEKGYSREEAEQQVRNALAQGGYRVQFGKQLAVENEDPRRSTAVTTPKLTKRGQLWRAITKQAEDQAVDRAAEEGVQVTPELVAAIRGQIVAADEALQRALAELPGGYEEPAPVEEEPVMKGADAFSKIEQAAREAFPGLYVENRSQAITKIARHRPDLVADYHAAHGAKR